MKLIIQFTKKSGLIQLPIDYNHLLQSFLYRLLRDDSYRTFLHEEGYVYKKRNFKGFTFSRLQGEYTLDREKGLICFHPPVTWIVTAAEEQVIQGLMNSLVHQGEFRWLNQEVQLESLRMETIPRITPPVVVETLSPITMYTTLVNEQNQKRTHYYHYEDEAFSTLIAQNLVKKYVALTGEEPKETTFSLTPVHVRKRPVVVRYKGFIIKGWNGRFKCTGSPELIRFALQVGLGGKSSQGFGCIEVWNGD